MSLLSYSLPVLVIFFSVHCVLFGRYRGFHVAAHSSRRVNCFRCNAQFLQEESVRRIALNQIGELFPKEVHTTSSALVLSLYAFARNLSSLGFPSQCRVMSGSTCIYQEFCGLIEHPV